MRWMVVVVVVLVGACGNKSESKQEPPPAPPPPPREPAVPPLQGKGLKIEIDENRRLVVSFEVIDAKGKPAVLEGRVIARLTASTGASVCYGNERVEESAKPRLVRVFDSGCSQPPPKLTFAATVEYTHPHGTIKLEAPVDSAVVYKGLGAGEDPADIERKRQAVRDTYAALVKQLPKPGAPAVQCGKLPELSEPLAVDSALLAELAGTPIASDPDNGVDAWLWIDSDAYVRERTELAGKTWVAPQYPKRSSQYQPTHLFVYHFAERRMPKVTTPDGVAGFTYRGASVSGSLVVVSYGDLKVVCHAPFAVASSKEVSGTSAFDRDLGQQMLLFRDLRTNFDTATGVSLKAMEAGFVMPEHLRKPKPVK
jgi:hypothetical protein